MDGVGSSDVGANLVGEGLQGRLVDVGDGEAGARLGEKPREGAADLANALDGDAPTREVGRAPEEAGRAAHGGHQPAGGDGGGVAGAAGVVGRPGDVPGLPGNHLHVGDGRPHVLGGDVGAAKRLDGTTVRAQQAFGLEGAGIADDDALSSAVVETSGGVLAGHGAGEAERVGEGVLLALVGVEARASEGRSENGRVNGNDGPQARLAILGEEQALVTVLFDGSEYLHGFDGSAATGRSRTRRKGR